MRYEMILYKYRSSDPVSFFVKVRQSLSRVSTFPMGGETCTSNKERTGVHHACNDRIECSRP